MRNNLSKYFNEQNIFYEHPFLKGYLSNSNLISMESKLLELEIQDYSLKDLKELANKELEIKLSKQSYTTLSYEHLFKTEYQNMVVNKLRHKLLVDKRTKEPFYDKFLDKINPTDEKLNRTHKSYVLVNILVGRMIEENINKKIFDILNLEQCIDPKLLLKYKANITTLNAMKDFFKTNLDKIYGEIKTKYPEYNQKQINALIHKDIYENKTLLSCVDKIQRVNIELKEINLNIVNSINSGIISIKNESNLDDLLFLNKTLEQERKSLYIKYTGLNPENQRMHQQNMDKIQSAQKTVSQTIKASSGNYIDIQM